MSLIEKNRKKKEENSKYYQLVFKYHKLIDSGVDIKDIDLSKIPSKFASQVIKYFESKRVGGFTF